MAENTDRDEEPEGRNRTDAGAAARGRGRRRHDDDPEAREREELGTRRKELQALNEELSTLNGQLQERKLKLKELEDSNNDLVSLLASTDIATIFLDAGLNIRRFTPAARRMLNLTESDIGRPVADLARRVDDPLLIEECGAVLRDLQPREADRVNNVLDDVLNDVLDDVLHDGARAYLRRVRPYRTADDRIDGVIVTYADVTRLRSVMRDLRRRERQHAAVAELGQMGIGGADLPAVFDQAVRVTAECLGCSHAKVLQREAGDPSLLLRAAVGFEGVEPGRSRVPTGLESQAGFTLRAGAPVIVRDLREETRFSGPAILTDAGIVSGISVLIGSRDDPWGVLGVHSTEQRDFSLDDVAFVQSMANLLGALISARAHQEERSALADRLETVLDASGVATWVWDPESDRSIWDNRMAIVAGLSAGIEPSGAAFFKIIHPEDRPRVRDAVKATIERGVPFNAEFRVLGADGRTRWIAGIGKRLDGPDGRRVSGVNIDISSRIRSEERLAESEKRREMAIEAARLGTWEYVAQTRKLSCDDRFLAMVGYPPGATLTLDDLERRVHPEDWGIRQAAIRAALAGTGRLDVEYRIYLDGDERWIRSQGYVFRDSAGARLVGLAEDITDRKRAEERQRLLMAELDHRVKNILANVNAIVRQTVSSRSDPGEFADALEGRLTAMADAHSLLSAARWSGVELSALLEAELAPYGFSPKGPIRMAGPRFLLSPKAAQALCLFVHELATNAAKHGALRLPDGRLSITWEEIDDDRLRFRWIEEASEQVGPPERRGFGLSVIEKMTSSDLNAEVGLDFRPTGLVCTLTVDRQEIAVKGQDPGIFQALPFRRAGTPQPETGADRPLRILVVEDVWAVAAHLEDLLTKAGHEVVGPASRLRDGLALADTEEIDAAILDVRLHDELVFPLADRLEERGIPYAFATGYAETEVFPERLSHRPVLPKPYTEALIAALTHRLAAARR